jgi:hypothetical protein
MTTSASDAAAMVECAIFDLLERRVPGASLCPSEVARAVDGEAWRARMDEVRAVALRLAREGRLVITQRGVALDPARPLRGAVRLARPPG